MDISTAAQTEDFMLEFSRQYEKVKAEDGWDELLSKGSHPANFAATATPRTLESVRAAALATRQTHQFKKGDEVELNGLQSADHLNGQQGVVRKFDEPTQRYRVRLMNSKNKKGQRLVVSVKETHMKRLKSTANSKFKCKTTTDICKEDKITKQKTKFREPAENLELLDSTTGTPPTIADSSGKSQESGNVFAEQTSLKKAIKGSSRFDVDYSRFDNIDEEDSNDDCTEVQSNMTENKNSADLPFNPAAAEEALNLLSKIKREADERAAERKRWRERWGD